MNIIGFNELYLMEKETVEYFYHYTSPQALISIISNNSIRFTDCEFLNDIEEYNYIKQLLNPDLYKCESRGFKDHIEFLYKNINNENEDYFILRENGKKFGRLKRGKYYVISGTHNKDSLPMWVYYSHGEGYYGYSLQFDLNRFVKLFEGMKGSLIYGDVVYTKTKQIKIISRELNKILDKYEEQKAYFNHVDEDLIVGDSLDLIQRLRLFFKNPGFSHEKEFRLAIIVSSVFFGDDINIGFDAKKGIIRPYVDIKFSGTLPLQSIGLSPSIESNLGIKGIKELLKTKGIDDCDVVPSKLQLRY